jgi:serine/threonine protein kinase
MAASAVAGESGVDVTGYRDYRGVAVIGAWTWLPEHGFGVATEIDVAEAFRTLYILRAVFFSMFALLFASSVAIFVFSVHVARLNREARRAALEAKQLGQYTLDEKLGEGGMGVVYRAHHALLHRPTAVKFLDVDKTTEQAVARFEREVQLTSRLNHPNTIAIYDYGRTAEGIFYYAMEYLDGLNLEDLVRRYGPQPDGRVVSILRQMCGSLHEAHGLGLIHRDIKPANVVLNSRGGTCDVVKVLDFGLVKALDSQTQASLTSAGGLTGTPLYLSPEAIQRPESVDARSDLYAVGAVGYYLLTGTAVFDGASVLEIVQHHAHTPPQPPSQRLGQPVSADVEEVLLRCLAKDPSGRPQSARELAAALAGCAVTTAWTDADAERWWRTYRPQVAPGAPPATDDGRFAATLLQAGPDDAEEAAAMH